MAETTITKQCSHCKKSKSISEFGKAPRNKDGHQGKCKACLKLYQQHYEQSERAKIKQKRYRQSNKGKIVKKKYPDQKTHVMYQGIDPDRWYPANGMKWKHPCVGLLQGATIGGKTKEMLILQKVLDSMPDGTFYWVVDVPYAEKMLPGLEKFDSLK